MDYKRLLEIAQKNQISVLSLNVAYEVHCAISDYEYEEKDFNKLCDYLEWIYLKSDGTNLEHIIMYARDLIAEGKKIEEIITINKRDFLEQTNYRYGGF